jgi:hypothetical protein
MQAKLSDGWDELESSVVCDWWSSSLECRPQAESGTPVGLERPEVRYAIRFGHGAAFAYHDGAWNESLERALARDWQSLGRLPAWPRVRRLVRRAWEVARGQARR